MKSSEYHRKQALTLLVMARATRNPKTASALAELATKHTALCERSKGALAVKLIRPTGLEQVDWPT